MRTPPSQAASGSSGTATTPNSTEAALTVNRTLVAGWFSFEQAHATAGDLLAAGVAAEWLEEAGHLVDVATAPPFTGGVDWSAIDPARYTHVAFVCGPFYSNRDREAVFLERFAHCRLIGLNLSMRLPLREWQPFDLLLERDSDETVRPDLAFVARTTRVPVIGVCLVEKNWEARTEVADPIVRALLASMDAAVVEIDTRLDANLTGHRSPAEIETLIARMDVVVTTRLHGMVLALKHGVPALAVDAVPGGGKISRQAQALGWPAVVPVDELDIARLRTALQWCLSPAARPAVAAARDAAFAGVGRVRSELSDAIQPGGAAETRFAARLAAMRDRSPAAVLGLALSAPTAGERLAAAYRSLWAGSRRSLLRPLKYGILRLIGPPQKAVSRPVAVRPPRRNRE